MEWRHKPRAKRSPIWKVPASDFKHFNSLAAVLRSLGLHVGAGNYRTLQRRLAEDGIDVTHMDPNIDRAKNARSVAAPLSDILVQNSPYLGGTSKIKQKLLKAGILVNKCSLCGLGGEWNGAPIHHRLDHINGDSRDYRVHNLRMVCPNCDSQLPTFAGRNAARKL